jgi:hypothetical protein
VGDDHELVQGRPANDGVEREVDLRDIEDDAPRVVVLRCPERDREGDAPHRMMEPRPTLKNRCKGPTWGSATSERLQD